MLCVGEILNFMTRVALCWMLGCDWELSVGGKQEAELGSAGAGWEQTPPRCSGAAVLQGRDEGVEGWGCSDFGV